MRYYEIVISPSTLSPQSFTPITFSSQYLGTDNYASLQMTIDLFQYWLHQPTGYGHIQIWGVDYQTLKQNLNFANITVSVGMTKGLPLVNPSQTQVLSGFIVDAYSNWQGTDVNLNLAIVPFLDYSHNITFIWPKDTDLTTAVTNTLKTAFKGSIVKGAFSSNLKWTESLAGQFTNLTSFGSKIYEISKSIITDPNYAGASITSTSYGFYLSDATQSGQIHSIQYTDVIGNITWIGQTNLQMKVTMRGNIYIGDYIDIPFGSPILNSANSYAQFKNNMSYNGKFYINKVRHVGNFRQADANSWVTVIDMTVPAQLAQGIAPA